MTDLETKARQIEGARQLFKIRIRELKGAESAIPSADIVARCQAAIDRIEAIQAYAALIDAIMNPSEA